VTEIFINEIQLDADWRNLWELS